MYDVVVVGHLCIDSILLPGKNRPYVILGGSAAYVSLSATRLGSKASIISKVGGDFPKAYLWWLKEEGVDLSGVARVADAQSTRFELKYNDDFSNRILRLKSRAPSITIDDTKKSLKAKALHIAPIAGEITYETVEGLKGCADVLSLDPQGLIRDFDGDGNIVGNKPVDKRILEFVNIYKSTLEEIKAVSGLSDLQSAFKAIHDFGVETILVTMGLRGAVMSIEKTTYNIPAFPTGNVIDPTGAGNVFIGSFLADYIRGEDIVWCAYVGSAAASIAVESVGPTGLGEKTEIYQRARLLYEKEL
ncbi:MAG: PfkB family carbohydrate kinase [Candidatus Bathyarchaeia archaeon]